MSEAVLPRPRVVGPRRNFAIVASEYNAQYVQALVTFAATELNQLMPNAHLSLFRVPGAFEIPIVVQELATQKSFDAIIALGVILLGETEHGTHIGQVVSQALQTIALTHRIPIVHEVLTVKNDEQARVRCLEKEHNRGTEAARVAVEMSRVIAELKGKN